MATVFAAIAAALSAICLALCVLLLKKRPANDGARELARLSELCDRSLYLSENNARAVQNYLDFLAKSQSGSLKGLQEQMEALNASTEKLIDAGRLKLMKQDAILINTARGAIVDEMAVYEAVKNREIFAYAADAAAVEPIPADHPLCGIPHVISLRTARSTTGPACIR